MTVCMGAVSLSLQRWLKCREGLAGGLLRSSDVLPMTNKVRGCTISRARWVVMEVVSPPSKVSFVRARALTYSVERRRCAAPFMSAVMDALQADRSLA
jgi:hypothetical protein